MIGILCFWDRAATPYLEKYERVLSEADAEYEVIFWNRTGMPDQTLVEGESEVCIACGNRLDSKVTAFFMWEKQAKALLLKRNYDFLIILSTYPGVLLSGFLHKHYRGRYIFDIRDYSKGKNTLVGYVVNRLVAESTFTAISSKAFLRFLRPSPKIVLNHNLVFTESSEYDPVPLKEKKTIRFTFVGNIRLDKQTRAVLLSLKDSRRYFSCFAGRILPGCDIREYCEAEGIQNVSFSGEFTHSQKSLVYQNVDMINAIYVNHSSRIRLADATPLPNRVYDAAIYGKPIVASKGTYLAELIAVYGLGFSVDGFSKNVESDFDRYLSEFDEKKFREGCQMFLNDVGKEEERFLQLLKETIDGSLRQGCA